MNSLNALFKPRSIAVVGASKDTNKLGYVLLKNVIDYEFQGAVYPVNPTADVILGKKAYHKVSAIPEPVDLALLSVPNQFVLQVVEECSECGVKAIVILSSGFGEAGDEGKELQERIKNICIRTRMRVMGPNCMGVYNLSGNLNGTYFWELPRIRGNISFISQSGAYGGILFNEIRHRRIGIAKFASIGNMVDINHTDLLKYLAEDDETQVIAIFIEDIRDGREFMEVSSWVSKVKPIVAFKAGRTVSGKRAAQSHTGAMAGEFDVYESAFNQVGVILAKNTEEFFDVATALSSWSKCLPKTRNLAILTISGGPSVIASDTAEEIGLSVPMLKDKVREEVRKYIPSFGADSNPVDMTPQMNPANYASCVDRVVSQPEIGGVIAINVGLDRTEFANAFVEASKKYNKPVVSFTIDTPELSKIFHNNHIPIYPTPERSVYAYNGLVRYSEYLKKKAEIRIPKSERAIHESPLLKRFIQEERKILAEYESAQILREYGIPVCHEMVAKNVDEALKYAKAIGYPVVVKIYSPDIIHKSEAGGVFGCMGEITSPVQLRDACQKLMEKFGVGNRHACSLLVQEFVKGTHELIIGGKRDHNFGPVIVFGIGGILTEVLHDISLRICPINRVEAMEMIEEINGYPLLKGYRGKPSCNIPAIVDVLLRVSDLLLSNPAITELDINPLIVETEPKSRLGGTTKTGLVAVDALIVIEKSKS